MGEGGLQNLMEKKERKSSHSEDMRDKIIPEYLSLNLFICYRGI